MFAAIEEVAGVVLCRSWAQTLRVNGGLRVSSLSVVIFFVYKQLLKFSWRARMHPPKRFQKYNQMYPWKTV